MMFPTFPVQHTEQACNECKRPMMVEVISNGVSHIMGLSVWCPDCVPVFREKQAVWQAKQQEQQG